MRSTIKNTANALCTCAMWPAWLLVVFSKFLTRADEMFVIFAQLLAVCPGKPGEYVRRAYYRLTLERCGSDLVVGFGSLFTSRDVVLGDRVWIGQYSILGSAHIGTGVLISDHVSVLTGRHHHTRSPNGELIVDRSRRQPVNVGKHTWIGAGAIIMADVGDNTQVGAGAVVVKALPGNITAVGVPARAVHREPR